VSQKQKVLKQMRSLECDIILASRTLLAGILVAIHVRVYHSIANIASSGRSSYDRVRRKSGDIGL